VTFLPHVIIAEADLASQTRMLTQFVARPTLEGFRLEGLTLGLMFELIVLAQKHGAEGTHEETTALILYTTIAFQAQSIDEHTGTRMRSETFLAMTNPSLAEVADCTDHLHTGGVNTYMLDHTITALHQALLFTTLTAHRKLGDGLAEVAVGTILLHALTFIALHSEVTGSLSDVNQSFVRTDVLLAKTLLISFLPRSGFLLRHVADLVKVGGIELS